jgi:hypothetical protein
MMEPPIDLSSIIIQFDRPLISLNDSLAGKLVGPDLDAQPLVRIERFCHLPDDLPAIGCPVARFFDFNKSIRSKQQRFDREMAS